MAEYELVYSVGHIACFGCVVFEKFHPRRCVEKQISHNNGCAFGATGFFVYLFFAALNGIVCAYIAAFGTCQHFNPCYRGNSRQRFTSETES